MPGFENVQRRDPPHPAGESELPVIEALRGLAALLVLISHYVVFVRDGAGPWGVAAVGVDLFFVLSGFVFARALAQGGIAWGPHLLRRFFRLYPLYIVALLLYALLQPVEGRWSGWWAHVFMLHTSTDMALASRYNVAFWSLPPEVEFYLILPVLAAAMAAAAGRLRGAVWCLLGLALALKLGLVTLATPGEAPDSVRSVLTVHLPGLLVEFLLGSAAAVATGQVRAPHFGSAWPSRTRLVGAALGLLLAIALLIAYSHQLATPAAAAQANIWFSGNFGLMAALSFALLLLGLNPSPRANASSWLAPNRAWWHGVASWAGRLSYGVYLFHNAAPHLARRFWPGLEGWALPVASLLLTLLLATVLHLAVEAPCRRLGRSLASGWQHGLMFR